MCRKSYLQGCCTICIGIGLIMGYCLDSWFFCCCGGLFIMLLGLSMLCRK